MKKGYHSKLLAIKEPLTSSPVLHEKALHEIEILKKLAYEECPSTLKYYSSTQAKFPYKNRVMMDFFLNSETYSRHLARFPETLTFKKKLFFLIKVIQTLHLFHRCGVYHMDVSFGNILICRNFTKIIDFGESFHKDLLKTSNRVLIQDRVMSQGTPYPSLPPNASLLKNTHKSTTSIPSCSSLLNPSSTAIPSTGPMG